MVCPSFQKKVCAFLQGEWFARVFKKSVCFSSSPKNFQRFALDHYCTGGGESDPDCGGASRIMAESTSELELQVALSQYRDVQTPLPTFNPPRGDRIRFDGDPRKRGYRWQLVAELIPL